VAILHTATVGLSADDAAKRRDEHGPNVVRLAAPTSAWRILLDQFRSIIIALLGVAALVAWATADPMDAIAIGVVLLLNVALGFITEVRARRAIEALSSLTPRRAVVRRPTPDGTFALEEIDAATLVPGDVVVVEAGNAVPADARLLDSVGLRVNEAPLTGESSPVSKRIDVVAADTPLAERTNLLFNATVVVDGRASAVVVATGMRTEVGRIGTLLSGVTQGRTPLERRLDQLGGRLVWLALGVAAIVGGLGWLQGLPWPAIIATSLALAVAAVPEGLPAVATIALAVGVHRMAKRQALVRRLPSVESLGSVTVVCTDKTGTLTAGEMTATRVWLADGVHHISGAGYGPEGVVTPRIVAPFDLAVRVAVLAGRGDATREGDVWVPHGDPTDVALLVLGQKTGHLRTTLLTEWPEIAEVPFSSDYRLMATFHQVPNAGIVACVKGAPATLLDRSTMWMGPDGTPQPLDSPVRTMIEAANAAFAAEGLRVIALASSPVTRTDLDALQGLTFLGLAGLIDPPAAGVDDTIRRFRAAGVRTVMITGDQQMTARAVGLALGILDADDAVTTGRTVVAWTTEALVAAVPTLGAFSRVSPEAKLRIVSALQSRGEVVAVLGDGVNDAAALKQADVGVAMGRRGTDVAREAADVVLQDDWFPTIGAAIEEGRVIYDNIRKFVFYLFSCNLAEILVLLVAGVVGGPVPLVPLQILWLNLVTDTFPALALALEPAEPGVMERPPRDPRAAMLSAPFLRAITFHGVTIATVTLVAFWALPSTSAAHASTMAFMTLALAQLFHLGNARSHVPVLTLIRMRSNPWAVGSVVLVVALQVASVAFEPLRLVLHTTSLSAEDWLMVMALSGVPALIGQTLRTCRAGKTRT
jgi:Ca2+-transporting ATPase